MCPIRYWIQVWIEVIMARADVDVKMKIDINFPSTRLTAYIINSLSTKVHTVVNSDNKKYNVFSTN